MSPVKANDTAVHIYECISFLVVAKDGSLAGTVVSGALEVGSQYHFQMETQSCLIWPIENGQFEVRCPTQFQLSLIHI